MTHEVARQFALERFIWWQVLRQILEFKALCLARWTLCRLTFPEICPMNTTVWNLGSQATEITSLSN